MALEEDRPGHLGGGSSHLVEDLRHARVGEQLAHAGTRAHLVVEPVGESGQPQRGTDGGLEQGGVEPFAADVDAGQREGRGHSAADLDHGRVEGAAAEVDGEDVALGQLLAEHRRRRLREHLDLFEAGQPGAFGEAVEGDLVRAARQVHPGEDDRVAHHQPADVGTARLVGGALEPLDDDRDQLRQLEIARPGVGGGEVGPGQVALDAGHQPGVLAAPVPGRLLALRLGAVADQGAVQAAVPEVALDEVAGDRRLPRLPLAIAMQVGD